MVLYNPNSTLANLGSIDNAINVLRSADVSKIGSLAHINNQASTLTARMDAIQLLDSNIVSLMGQVQTLTNNAASMNGTLTLINTAITGFETSLSGTDTSYNNYLSRYDITNSDFQAINLSDLENFTGVVGAFISVFAA
jgi:hypothetical protein